MSQSLPTVTITTTTIKRLLSPPVLITYLHTRLLNPPPPPPPKKTPTSSTHQSPRGAVRGRATWTTLSTSYFPLLSLSPITGFGVSGYFSLFCREKDCITYTGAGPTSSPHQKKEVLLMLAIMDTNKTTGFLEAFRLHCQAK